MQCPLKTCLFGMDCLLSLWLTCSDSAAASNYRRQDSVHRTLNCTTAAAAQRAVHCLISVRWSSARYTEPRTGESVPVPIFNVLLLWSATPLTCLTHANRQTAIIRCQHLVEPSGCYSVLGHFLTSSWHNSSHIVNTFLCSFIIFRLLCDFFMMSYDIMRWGLIIYLL